MSTSTEIKKMSFEEYERLPEEIRSELYQGELIEITPGTPKHNDIRDEIAFTLREFVRKNKLGRIYLETAFRLFPDVVLIPDVAYVSTEQLKNADLERAAFLFAPLLAVEVISPANSPLEIIRKRELYLSAGTKTVWIVYPPSRTVKVYRQGSERIETSALSDSELLPGFSLSISEAFARADL